MGRELPAVHDTKGVPGEGAGGGVSMLKQPRGHLQLPDLQSARRAGRGLAAAPGARGALDPRSPAGARPRRLGLRAGSGARRARAPGPWAVGALQPRVSRGEASALRAEGGV